MAGSLAAVLAAQLAFVAVRPTRRSARRSSRGTRRNFRDCGRRCCRCRRRRVAAVRRRTPPAARRHRRRRDRPPTALETRAGWTLLFNAGSENEGIYSRLGADGVNLVLLFEVEEDAGRYIDMLEAQDFPSARAVEIETADLLAFCDEGGHALGLVPADAVVVPPEATVDTFDWKVGESTEARRSSRARRATRSTSGGRRCRRTSTSTPTREGAVGRMYVCVR